MDSFANVDVNYPDGQTNKTVVPAEIQARGFKPPIRTATGELEKGDNLAANHLNFILNDIYNKLKASGDSAITVVEAGGDTANGYRSYSNGHIEMWGTGTPGADGNVTITYPVVLPALTRDIQISMLSTPDGTNMDLHAGMIISQSQTPTGFRARCIFRSSGSTSNGASQNGFTWRANYHPAVAKK
ncbi:hypothetical protein DIBBI_gp27 [Xanthomonas phage vB_XveM_DIBBI]|uniref:Putative tail fiber protein gp53-like C-terminal domain-containing protein n=1 Tax=Xanthomonas phage vB_XveM_DIBBI TaxID=1129194 RepID=I3PGW0_9CAUD|nr:hypothetical protein DIBBI_gp27 [Xanthomonas phage vB_XveM_DIBBI]AEX65695.1 hypothetical protein DIBBI_027 [Xanthomonas phage vB_XveM_DIBBI]